VAVFHLNDTWQKSGLKTDGKSGQRQADLPTQPPVSCPKCGSTEVWRDGHRWDDDEILQRFVCCECGHRYSEREKPKKSNSTYSERQVCETLADGSKNLAKEVEALGNVPLCGGASSKFNKAGLESLLIDNFLWYLKKQGKSDGTIDLYTEVLGVLAKRGADLQNSESVKKVIALQESWSSSRKNNAVKSYSAYLESQGLTWDKPKFKVKPKDPFIPEESEIDSLIHCSSKQMSAFLQMLKETAARRGESFDLKWTDIDFVAWKVRITPEKGSNPRTLPISEKLIRMLNNLPRTSESNRVWGYKNVFYLDKQFRRQRKRIAKKLENPRLLQIHFHTLRHWRATMWLYETDGKIYKVSQWLGHKSIKNTEHYIHLWQELFPENVKYEFAIIKAGSNQTEEALKLHKRGWTHYYNAPNGDIILRIPESLLKGASTIQKGSSASLADDLSGDIPHSSPLFVPFVVFYFFKIIYFEKWGALCG